jgi:MFS family permease
MFTTNVNRQLFYLFLCNLAIVFIGMGVFPILPLYAMAYGASPAVTGLFMASVYAAISGGTLVGGRLAAYVGRKRLFIATGLLSLPAVVLLGQATALWQVVLLTDLIWFAGGIGLTLTSVFTGLVAKSDSRGKAFTLLHLASPLGALIGGTTVSQLLAWKGYGPLFVALGLVWAVWPLAGLLVEDRPAAAPAAGGRQAVSQTAVPVSASFYVLILVTLLSAATINVSRLGTSLSMQALEFSASAVASTAAVSGLVTIPVALTIGTLSDRLGRRRFLSLSYLLAAAGALSLIVASQLWHFWLAATLLLVARSVSASVGAALATDILAPQELERGLGWLNTAGWITGTIAFAGAGHALEAMGAAGLYGVAAVLALAAALQLRRIRYRAAAPAATAVAWPVTLVPGRQRLAPAGVRARRLSFLLLLGLLLAACLPGPPGSQPPPPGRPTHTPAATAIASPTAAGTATATATVTPILTAETTATIAPAPEPAGTGEAEEIRLTLGGTSTIISGTLSGHSQKVYLLWVEAGQTLSIRVTSPDVSVLFHLHGRDDGEVYKHLLDGELSWQDRLPVSQYYVLTLDAIGEGDRPYTIDISLDGAIPA